VKKLHWLTTLCAAVLLAACTTQKEPAEQVVAHIDSAMNTIHDSAEKFSPDSYHTLENQVAALKGTLAKGDYQAVLSAAPAVSASIASLKQTVDSQQATADAELAKTKQQWRTLNDEVPKLVTAIQTQVDTLSKGRRLPKGLTKTKLEAAKTDAASLGTQWTDAVTTVTSGDYSGAVTKGQAVREKATSMMQELGMKSS
jgi:hypothetical protein